MNKYLLALLLFIGLYGCHTPTEIKIPGSAKPADEFARHFISNVISGKIDSSFTEINATLLNDTVKQYIINAHRSINTARVTSYRVVGLSWTSGFEICKLEVRRILKKNTERLRNQEKIK